MKTGRLASVAWFVLAVASLLCACAPAQLSVGHMKRAAWSLEEPRSLVTKFVRFDYQIAAAGEDARVKGWAWLDAARTPAWAKRIETMTFSAYLCDAEGRVLAHDTRTFAPRELRTDVGVPFDFLLRPKFWGDRPLFVSFGYRLTLTAGPGTGARGPFFVSEDAITQ